MEDCIFCKIVNKESSVDIVYDDEEIMAFKDIYPQAPVHILIICKRHISSVKDIESKDENLMGRLIFVAKEIAEDKKLKGYKLVFNVGREGGQIIDHIHLHLLSENKLVNV